MKNQQSQAVNLTDKKNALPVGLVGKADRAEWESFNILLY